MPKVDDFENEGHWMKGGFYLGTHVLSHAIQFFRAFISINILEGRRSRFQANRWIMDSGAFTKVTKYGGYPETPEVYAEKIAFWKRVCPETLRAAVTEDYMCEEFVLKKTGLSVLEHQELTIERYDRILYKNPGVYIMPVLQGYQPEEYVDHIQLYGPRLKERAWVGVGSVCKRNSNPTSVYKVLLAIRAERPDLRLHGFGLKITALEDARVVRCLWSSDSMAWSMSARRNGQDANGIKEAKAYEQRVNLILEKYRD